MKPKLVTLSGRRLQLPAKGCQSKNDTTDLKTMPKCRSTVSQNVSKQDNNITTKSEFVHEAQERSPGAAIALAKRSTWEAVCRMRSARSRQACSSARSAAAALQVNLQGLAMHWLIGMLATIRTLKQLGLTLTTSNADNHEHSGGWHAAEVSMNSQLQQHTLLT